MKRYDIRIF